MIAAIDYLVVHPGLVGTAALIGFALATAFAFWAGNREMA